MRGSDRRSGELFSYVDVETRVRSDHPLRTIRSLVNETLDALSGEFDALYAAGAGRPSIPPEMLLRAMLLQAFYTIRSERQLMERLEFDLLFRWFVGLSVDEPAWDHSTFSKNRDRLLDGEVAAKFLAAVLNRPKVKRLLSSQHFSADGPLPGQRRIAEMDSWTTRRSISSIRLHRDQEARRARCNSSRSPPGSISSMTRGNGGPIAEFSWEGDDEGEQRSSRAHRNAAGEALRIEDFEEGGEGVGVPVVRRCRQQEPMLEAARQIPHGLRELAVDGVSRTAGRSRMMGLVQDHHGARAELAQRVPQTGDVGIVDEEAVGDDEERAGGPRVRRKAALPPQGREMLAIDDHERQPELRLQLVLPLPDHPGRRRDQGEVHPPAKHHLAQDQPGLDGLAGADVVRDQQVDARQAQGLPKRQELVGVEPNSGPERRLKEVPIGSGRRTPTERPQVGREHGGIVGAGARDSIPALVAKDFRIELGSQDDIRRLTLRVVVDAGHANRGQPSPELELVLDEPSPAAKPNEIAWLNG